MANSLRLSALMIADAYVQMFEMLQVLPTSWQVFASDSVEGVMRKSCTHLESSEIKGRPN